MYNVQVDIDSQNYFWEDVSSNENQLDFEIELTNVKRARELIILIDYKPVVSFKLK